MSKFVTQRASARMARVRFLWIAALLVSCSTAPEANREHSARAGQAESLADESPAVRAKQPAPRAPTGDDNAAEPGILVELFTSQGCSSCPPADELLADLDARLDANIIPLAFHVDYWNYIGWRDPFSSKRWSSRQKNYARKISKGRAYTPQLVVGGAGHAVGSRFAAIEAEVASQSKRKSQARLDGRIAFVDGATLEVTIDSSLSGSVSAHLMVALYESGLQTAVPRGENRGRRLMNDFVVRDLRDAGALSPGTGRHRVVFEVDSEWRRANMGVVIFAQDPQSLRVFGAQRLRAEPQGHRR